jgi:uncharacterized protein (TIGR00106 family)
MTDGQTCTEEIKMLAEFSVVPLGKGESVSQYVAECMKIVDGSGIKYRINPMGTVLEGEYDQVMEVVKACHMRVMELSQRVITSVKIDDRKGRKDMLDRKIESVEKKLGIELRK